MKLQTFVKFNDITRKKKKILNFNSVFVVVIVVCINVMLLLD